MLNQVFDQDGGALPLDRRRIERAIEALIELLDAADPDPDFEPSLGWTRTWDGAPGAYGSTDEREECDDFEPDTDREEDFAPDLNERPRIFGEAAI